MAEKTVVKKSPKNQKALMHVGTGSDLIPGINSLPAKQQKKLITEYFLEAQKQIADLDVIIDNDTAVVKQITQDLNRSALSQKKKARLSKLNEQRKLKAELTARYAGAKLLAQTLGINVDTSKIQMIEGQGE